jgi:hypothetical protein
MENSCISILNASLHSVSAGEKCGWYRNLSDSSRVGHVATAQLLRALAKSNSPLDERKKDALLWLVRSQLPDGAWPFVSTINHWGVVDSTAWVLLALATYRKFDYPIQGIDHSIRRGTKWLINACNEEGGWGLCFGQKSRQYSTALAVRALVASTQAVTLCSSAIESAIRGAQHLVAGIDADGSCNDSQGRTSVCATAHTVLALDELVRQGQSGFVEYKSMCQKWLASLVLSTHYWTKGDYVAETEEVDVISEDGSISRIEYHHSHDLVATEAICIDSTWLPMTVLSMCQIIDKNEISNEIHSLKSWRIHDLISLLTSFRLSLASGTIETWSNGKRFAQTSVKRSPVFFLRKTWPALVFVIILSMLLLALVISGVFPQGASGWTVTAYIISAIIIGALGSILAQIVWGDNNE